MTTEVQVIDPLADEIVSRYEEARKIVDSAKERVEESVSMMVAVGALVDTAFKNNRASIAKWWVDNVGNRMPIAVGKTLKKLFSMSKSRVIPDHAQLKMVGLLRETAGVGDGEESDEGEEAANDGMTWHKLASALAGRSEKLMEQLRADAEVVTAGAVDLSGPARERLAGKLEEAGRQLQNAAERLRSFNVAE